MLFLYFTVSRALAGNSRRGPSGLEGQMIGFLLGLIVADLLGLARDVDGMMPHGSFLGILLFD